MGLGLTEAAIGEPSDPDAITASRVESGLPKRFGRYDVVRRLGQGAMGVVYLAKDLQLDRMVALKVPQFGKATEQEVAQRFQHEVRAAAAIQHANICPIHDVGEVDGVLYMSMAFIEGRPLSELLQSGRPFSIRRAAFLVRKLALALEEAHRRNVIHRDLKPANIMIDRRGEPVIMDFGLARRSHPQDLRLTRRGELVGTPAYMSPEQVAGGGDGPQADIYSLGVILYELLTGQLPFQGDLMEVLARIAAGNAPPPSRRRQELPPQLDAICAKALAKSLTQRYATMGQLAAELTDFLTSLRSEGSGLHGTAESGGLPDPSAQRSEVANEPTETVSRAWEPSRLLVSAAAIVVGGALAIAIFATLSRGNRAAVDGNSDQTGIVRSEPVRQDERSGAPPASAPTPTSVSDDESLTRLLTGRYLCFVEGNWAKGLPLLASCGQADLRELAELDLATQKREGQQDDPYFSAALRLGDGWRQLAERESGDLVTAGALRRASHWYRRAVSGIGDAEKKKAAEQGLVAVEARGDVPTGPADSKPPPAGSVAIAKVPAPAPPASPLPDVTPEKPAREPDAASPADKESPAGLKVVAGGPPPDPVDQLKKIDEERRSLIMQMSETMRLRDAELPEAYLKATSEYAKVVRLIEEAKVEGLAVALEWAAVERQTSPTMSPAERRYADEQRRMLRIRQENIAQRLRLLDTEGRGRTAEINVLKGRIAATSDKLQQLAARSQQLVERAFWASRPEGWLSCDDYSRIGGIFSEWLQNPNGQPESVALRSIAYANAGRLDEAFRDAQRGLQLSRASPLCTAAQGYARAKGGETAGVSDLTRAIRLAPKSAPFYLLRGIAQRLSRNNNGAIEDFSRVVELAPDQPAGHCFLAMQLAAAREDRLRDGERACQHAERSCALTNRSNWACLDALAAAHAELGRFTDAVNTQQSAVELAPTDHKPACDRRLASYRNRIPFRLD